MKYITALLLAITVLLGTQRLCAVEMGADRLDLVLPHLEGRRVALIINHTSVVGTSQTCLLDTLISLGVDVKCVFAPEHGFRGDADAGETVANGRDLKTGVPIISLYGANKRPTHEQLSGVECVIFDIQDVGTRFYTYISTMFYAMEECSKFNVSFMVLDRPNPNDYIDGPIITDNLKSFVGALSIPILHGLTVGELALMINGEGWQGSRPLDLVVVPMMGWQHGDPYDLPIKPSPNLPNAQAVALYPSLCLFEATRVSVGRGTYTPFQLLGYPDPKFGEFTFMPRALPGFDKNPLQKDKTCYGVDLRHVDPPKGLSLSYFIEFMKLSGQGGAFISSTDFFNKLSGDATLKPQLIDGRTEAEIRQGWAKPLAEYKAMRRKYLLYPDIRNL
ncbi:MAG: DUF1343 domain-containing protein [Rikenellaceae bacterium]